MALAVEKTSKRGGRILHEKDLMPPPPLFSGLGNENSATPPPQAFGEEGGSEYGGPGDSQEAEKPSITELMRNPSKVVMCKVCSQMLSVFAFPI